MREAQYDDASGKLIQMSRSTWLMTSSAASSMSYPAGHSATSASRSVRKFSSSSFVRRLASESAAVIPLGR